MPRIDRSTRASAAVPIAETSRSVSTEAPGHAQGDEFSHAQASALPPIRVNAAASQKPAELRLAQRMTADEAVERIVEFNALFANPDYDFKDLRNQNFERALDQSAVEKKLAGKGIGPYYLNDKGDKMLAADRDAHGGGTFKYFKKVSNRWVRQATLDDVGRPMRG